MFKYSKRNFIELIIFIILCITIILSKKFIINITNIRNPYFLLETYIINSLLAFAFGIFVCSIGKNISFKIIHFNIIYFISFIGCIIIVICLWIFQNKLPNILIKNFQNLNYIISAYAGANFLSIIFNKKV